MHTFPALVLVCSLIAVHAAAQPSDAFEVASVKLGDPVAPNTSFHFGAGGLRVENATLKDLILYAYDLREFQLSGATGWMTSERYTIQAKGQSSDTGAALVRKRLRHLLAERFQLSVHPEVRQLPMYALVVAKGGHKLTPNPSPDGSLGGASRSSTTYKAKRATLASIAQGLADITRRPVQDETGLAGFYDFEMKWTPDAPAAAPDRADPRPADTAGPTLFTALQEQLGLKLESRKGPAEILVIDRAGRPSEN